MIAIVTIDDKGGMMFNKRRQSKDSILREKILSMTSNSKLWMNEYSKKQFEEESPQIVVSEDFLEKAGPGDYCFVENVELLPYDVKIEGMIVCHWNRQYPSDQYLDVDLKDGSWILENVQEFEGHSHEKITMEEYRHE